MATKSKAKSPVRPHDVKVPPPPKPTPPGANHRHAVPQGVERRAQELVHEAGSVHQAKKAIDSADVAEGASDFREDQLALQWGFRSRKDMLAASKPSDLTAGGRGKAAPPKREAAVRPTAKPQQRAGRA